MIQIPATTGGLFWSANRENIDLARDRAYITHQVLAYGTLEDIHWLMDTYGESMVRETFLRSPIKIYTPRALHMATLLLNIPFQEAKAYHYDKTLPRYIG